MSAVVCSCVIRMVEKMMGDMQCGRITRKVFCATKENLAGGVQLLSVVLRTKNGNGDGSWRSIPVVLRPWRLGLEDAGHVGLGGLGVFGLGAALSEHDR